jgi:hypothetical protein
MDIAKVIFIDDDTDVEFTSSGKLTVDNVYIPAFVIANSKNIRLANWNIVYDASLPVQFDVGGYRKAGQFVQGGHPGSAFNDWTMTPWLVSHRVIVFDQGRGRVTGFWNGFTNVAAMFYISGDSSNLVFDGMQVSAPGGAERFVPVVFSFNPNFASRQVINAKTPLTPQDFALPHDIVFSKISLDGTYMGWVGSVQNLVIENVRSHRYGDLQDADGGSVGGVGKWFAPPHLIYLSYALNWPAELYNRNIQIRNITDDGTRVGAARDKGGSDPGSGNALSLKLGCVGCSVTNYTTSRPDGFLDVLSSEGLTISNVVATYDSSFLNDIYPGWRFPKSPYKNIKFQNIVLKDLASTTMHLPIDNANDPANERLQLSNVQVLMNRWGGPPGSLPLPSIMGRGNSISLEVTLAAEATRISRSVVDDIEVTLQVASDPARSAAPSVLQWTSKNADSCQAAGAWSGPLPLNGSHSVQSPSDGAEFTLDCRRGNSSSRATVRIVAAP